MRKLALAVLLFAACAVASADDRAFVATHYDESLSLDFVQQSITAEESVTLRAQRAEATATLDADGLNIAAVFEGTTPLAFAQSGGELRVTLRRAPAAGETRTIRIRYSASKPKKGLRFGADQAFTAFHTSYWMVCQNDPAVKASLALAIDVPATLEAVSGGVAEGRDELPGGRVRYRFREERGYSSYLFGFAAAHFNEATAQARGVTLRYLSPTLSSDQLKMIFRETPEIFGFLQDLAGVPYPGATYTQVLMPDAPPQEMVEMSLMSDRYGRSILDDPREDYLIVHELSHTWWGNLATCRTWSDFWLNEGMATFVTALFKEHHWGREEYDREMAIARRRYEAAPANVKARPLAFTGWTTPEEMSGPVTYSKGALVLNLLRITLGDAAFRNGLRDYTRAAAGGTVVTDDLRRAMEAASGRDLRPFFAQWVDAPPPDFSAVHHIEPDAVTIDIAQHQPATWMCVVPVSVTTASSTLTRSVDVTKRQQSVRIATDGPVLSVAIDPNGTLPDTIAHARPVSMLVFQLANDPRLEVRVNAINELQTACMKSPCLDAAEALATSAAHDSSRLVRHVAADALAKITTH